MRESSESPTHKEIPMHFSEAPACSNIQEPSHRFTNVALEELLVIEVCAGSARLTKTCRKLGLRELAIDKSVERSCGVDIMTLDLTVPSQLQLLLDLIAAEKDKLLLVFIAPPCGTASRARGRPIKPSLLQGRKAPQPLLTDDQPDGKDNLSGTDKLKTELANQLYAAISDVVLLAHSYDVCVVVENPANSLYWKTSPAKRFLDTLQGYITDFHNCCHGGTRDKFTRFWSNKEWMQPLEQYCDGSHQHESWRPRVQNGQLVFPTSEEAAYPWLLCTRIVELILDIALKNGATKSETLAQQAQQLHFSMLNRYMFGALPRTTKLRPLVPEFASYQQVIAAVSNHDISEEILKLCPKGSKIVSRKLLQWGNFRTGQHHSDYMFFDIAESDLGDSTTVECYQVGIFFEPLQFVQQAISAGHPKDIRRFVDPSLHEVILDNFHRPPHLLAQKRIKFFKKYTAMAKECEADELRLRLSMPEHIRRLMVNKRLVLFGKMLEDFNFPDKDLIKDISEGFCLSGWMPESGIFPKKVKGPTLTLDALEKTTDSFNDKVRKQMSMRQDPKLEADTWEETCQELEHGWIWLDEAGSWSGKAVARRFGIKQSQKTRVIDDCSVCGLNLTVGTKEKFVLHSIDQLCSMVDHSFEMSPSDHCPILGRTYDLKSAYKQFGLRPKDRDLLRIAVNKPGSAEPILVGLNALPFGAVESVAAFLRISFAVWWLGIHGLGIAWSAYFDDYSALTRPELEASTHWSITSLFELVGLLYAKEGPKAPPFGQIFRMLGLVVNLEKACDKQFSVSHTEERKAELKACLQEVLDKGELQNKEAERIRGRMLFFECFVYGRVANLDLKLFGDLCRLGRTSPILTDSEKLVVSRLCCRIEEGKPIPLGIQNLVTWIIFTDGACEGENPVGSVGGVLVAPNGRLAHFFGDIAPATVMSTLLASSGHPIHELEMIPVLVSFHLWGHLIAGCQVVHYIDNESVRLALLRGSGETSVAREVASRIMTCEFSINCRSWYARVASHSNIADAPSRMDFSQLETLGSTRFSVNWDLVLASCTPLERG